MLIIGPHLARGNLYLIMNQNKRKTKLEQGLSTLIKGVLGANKYCRSLYKK